MIKILNLSRQNSIYKKRILSEIKKNIIVGDFILGKNNKLLEKKISKITKAKYCLSCSSGTDALLMSLMAIDIEPGDIVITTIYSYISTAEVIKFIGATPIFVDINNYDYNINTKKLEETIQLINNKSKTNYKFSKILKKNKKNKIKAIIAVSLFGKPADFKEINRIAKKNKIKVIEDAAQSFGAKYYRKHSGNLSDIGCFSFYPTKTLGAMGDAGAIVTNSKNIYKNLESIRVHGQSVTNGNFHRLGLTGRMDTIQASILLVKIKKINLELKLRKKIADLYNKCFLFNKNIIISTRDKNIHSANSVYTLKFKNKIIRNKVKKSLDLQNIQNIIYYKKPFHLQKIFKEYRQFKMFPNAEKASNTSLSIPIDPYLKKKEQLKIIKTINNATK